MNGLSVLGQKVDQNFNLKSEIANCDFYACSSDMIIHYLESSKPESFRRTLNVLMVQLSMLIW